MPEQKEKEISVVMVEPKQYAYIGTLKNELEAMQQYAGGYIEAFYPFDDPVVCVCNEEGKFLPECRPNRGLRDEDGKVIDVVSGKFFIAGMDDDGNLTSLPPELAEKYRDYFYKPQYFMHIFDEIAAVNYDLKPDNLSSRHNASL